MSTWTFNNPQKEQKGKKLKLFFKGAVLSQQSVSPNASADLAPLVLFNVPPFLRAWPSTTALSYLSLPPSSPHQPQTPPLSPNWCREGTPHTWPSEDTHIWPEKGGSSHFTSLTLHPVSRSSQHPGHAGLVHATKHTRSADVVEVWTPNKKYMTCSVTLSHECSSPRHTPKSHDSRHTLPNPGQLGPTHR